MMNFFRWLNSNIFYGEHWYIYWGIVALLFIIVISVNVPSFIASFIKKHILEIESGGVFFDDGSYCRFNGTRVTFFHSLYYPQDKVMRWFDVAEKIVGYICDDTFLSEQIHIDEIAEEMTETVPKSETVRADEQRPYKVELYKDDIDIILKSLRAADIPQDTYERIYEIIGRAEIL